MVRFPASYVKTTGGLCIRYLVVLTAGITSKANSNKELLKSLRPGKHQRPLLHNPGNSFRGSYSTSTWYGGLKTSLTFNTEDIASHIYLKFPLKISPLSSWGNRINEKNPNWLHAPPDKWRHNDREPAYLQSYRIHVRIVYLDYLYLLDVYGPWSI